MFFAFLTNLARSLFLTGWAYRNGPTSIEGTVHDVAGYAVLGLTVVGLLCLLPLLNLRLSVGAPLAPVTFGEFREIGGGDGGDIGGAVAGRSEAVRVELRIAEHGAAPVGVGAAVVGHLVQ
eukprot:gene633-804_t